ncbi:MULTISPECIES: hypothetical protein [Stenotrophomonas]|uniref:hypothetical protein n=1 Tax=Stenotrophomonas geniculata TaxID=86188 RepID=UPI0011B2830D
MARKIQFLRVLEAAWKGASLYKALLQASLLVVLGIIAAGLYSPFGLSIFEDAGAVADWVAAIGTWVIGFGAIRLAAGDRELKLHERREQKMLRLKLEISRFRNIASATNSLAYKLSRSAKYLDSLNWERASLADAFTAVTEIEAAVSADIWSEEDRAAANDETAQLMDDIQLVAHQLKGFIGYIKATFTDNAERRPASDLRGLLNDVGTSTKGLIEELDKVSKSVAWDLEGLVAQRERLRTRMQQEFEELF